MRCHRLNHRRELRVVFDLLGRSDLFARLSDLGGDLIEGREGGTPYDCFLRFERDGEVVGCGLAGFGDRGGGVEGWRG